MSKHRFKWSKIHTNTRQPYTVFVGCSKLETPQNLIFINTPVGRMKALRNAPGGARMNARNKRERAGGRARHWIGWSQ